MKVTISISLCLLLIFGMSACFTTYHGYGVILWADEEGEYVNGEVIVLLSESKLNEAYVIHKKNSKEEMMIPVWRVKFFSTNQEAEAYAKDYAPYRDMYVFSRQEGIPPVREEIGTSNQIKIVYKFKANQVAKVLSRTAEKQVIGTMEDYWYEVLIKNDVPVGSGKFITVGVKGFCYGYSLEVITANQGEAAVVAEKSEATPSNGLKGLFSGNWRTLSYQDMISARKIDLAHFSADWGLFADEEKQRISIILEKSRYIADYTEIVPLKANSYSFPDSTLVIDIISPDRISATFVTDSRQVSLYFVNIKADLNELITAEIERRSGLYTDLLLRGSVLSSSAYGSIRLLNNNIIEWSGLERLVPTIVPRQISGRGKLQFTYFLASDLKKKYDGVLTISFDEYSPAAGINFLYQYVENGIKLFFVDNSNLEENEIRREGSNQVIIFFTFKDA